MHLRQSDESVRFGGAVRAGAEASNDGRAKASTEGENNKRQNVKTFNEVELSTPEGLQRGDLVDAIFAGWTIFLHRYYGNALKWFSWSRSHQHGFTSVSFEALNFSALQTVADVVREAGELQHGDESARSNNSSIVFVRDGVNDEVSLYGRQRDTSVTNAI